MMKKGNKELWLEAAFICFAMNGPGDIKLKKLTEKLGVTRTTFYHHFLNTDELIDELLNVAILKSEEFASDIKTSCKNYIPDLHILLANNYSIELQFLWQLFRNRSVPKYNYVFSRVSETLINALVPKFIEYYNFNISHTVAANLLESLHEAWYSRLKPGDFNSEEKLIKHTEDIMETIVVFYRTELFNNLKENNQ